MSSAKEKRDFHKSKMEVSMHLDLVKAADSVVTANNIFKVKRLCGEAKECLATYDQKLSVLEAAITDEEQLKKFVEDQDTKFYYELKQLISSFSASIHQFEEKEEHERVLLEKEDQKEREREHEREEREFKLKELEVREQSAIKLRQLELENAVRMEEVKSRSRHDAIQEDIRSADGSESSLRTAEEELTNQLDVPVHDIQPFPRASTLSEAGLLQSMSRPFEPDHQLHERPRDSCPPPLTNVPESQRNYDTVTMETRDTAPAPSSTNQVVLDSNYLDLGARNVGLSHLPKINLKFFSGNLTDFQEFWDSFNCLIHSRHDLSNVQKLTYLKSVLAGKPAKLLSSVRLTEDNYLVAIQILRKHYDVPEIVVTKLYDEIIAMKPASDKLSDMHYFYLELEIRFQLLENQERQPKPMTVRGATVHIRDKFGSLHTVDVSVVPTIVGKVTHSARDSGVMSKLREEYDLADTGEDAEFDLLLGNDYYSTFMLGDVGNRVY
ncbi:hypothetical protein WDU94_012401 [Cyamophila willieti]